MATNQGLKKAHLPSTRRCRCYSHFLWIRPDICRCKSRWRCSCHRWHRRCKGWTRRRRSRGKEVRFFQVGICRSSLRSDLRTCLRFGKVWNRIVKLVRPSRDNLSIQTYS